MNTKLTPTEEAVMTKVRTNRELAGKVKLGDQLPAKYKAEAQSLTSDETKIFISLMARGLTK